MGLGDISLSAESNGPQRGSFKARGRVDQPIAGNGRWSNTFALAVDRPDAPAAKFYLTDAELALAQISGYWPKAREEFKVKLEEMKSRGWVFKLDFIMYVLLATMYQQGSKMEKLHAAENKEKIQETWKILIQSLKLLS